MQFAGQFRAVLTAVLRRRGRRSGRVSGTAQEICTSVINRLWNGTFYQIGLGHFNYFWIRDFGSVTDSLLAMGHRERVLKTLEWACGHYMKCGEVRLCVDKRGNVFDMPERSIDALPWLLHSLQRSEYPLSAELRVFLESEIQKYVGLFLAEDGRLRIDVSFSELRDSVRYFASAYAVTMLAVLARASRQLGLKTTLPEERFYADLLRHEYWNGKYLRADTVTETFATECNLFPLFLNVLPETLFRDGILATIREKNLCAPYPVRFTDTKGTFNYRWWARTFMVDYAADTVWSWLGGIYLQVLKRKGNAQEFEASDTLYASMIERFGTLPELLSTKGEWYETFFYRAEEGMIWCALYLSLHTNNATEPR